MKPDDFEQQLKRQPLQQVPAGWRGEILAAAESAAATRPSPPVTRSSWLSTLNHQLSTLLWPHPQAWAGLATVWVLILAVDFSVRDNSSAVVEKTVPPAPEVMVELRQQQRMLAELIGSRDTHDADRAKPFAPQPRSERSENLMT